ncbi:CoA transferase [Rhodococcus pseudokoreensis]|uniref:CoA transferase n=1 Tax=Rhodococcus pseudokoreensis TaxID=2811421 RepID=A0A974W974_9NOCA|nr:CoA transferase [Rhodococcus pseudokoreensis]QSE92992.1 CoA transferase [Rhodococcus pseudokoreensis]
MNDHTPVREGVLDGIKVVELCHLIAGPYCGMLLADEGADVIKVEPPQGELTRSREPIRTTDQGTMSGYFASLNRRKRSITLDLKSESGSALLDRLLADADVFITNMRGGALGRLGIHPSDLQERYPELIVVSMSGFGLFDAGLDANRAGLAMVAEALSGTTGLTRDREGRPTWCGFALGDIVTGMTAHSSVLLGLREREQTGRGRMIDLSLTECTLPLATVALARVQSSDAHLSKVAGANDFHGVPYGTFAAADGYYNIGVNRDDFWARLSRAMGQPELADDPRYATYVERSLRQREVEELLEAWSTQLTRAQVVDALTAVDVPVAPVLTMSEVLDNQHFADRGTFVEVDDAIGGSLKQPDDPTGFAVPTPARVPRLGEHRDAILTEIGVEQSQIESLAEGGAFGAAPHVNATA